MPRILVTGSRDWIDAVKIRRALEWAWDCLGRDPFTTLVHGDARGADRMAAGIWKGYFAESLIEKHPAMWREFPGRAGTLRNEHMVNLGADVCLAFPLPTSIGTRHCARIAEEAGIPTFVFEGEAA